MGHLREGRGTVTTDKILEARLRQVHAILDSDFDDHVARRAALLFLEDAQRAEAPGYRLWVNEERTVLVRVWSESGTAEVATREIPDHVWGPPITLQPEKVF